MPSRQFAINAAWLACALTAIDLLAWTQTILLHDQPALAKAEPKKLRYRLLHVAARLVPRRPQTPTQDRLHLALGTRTRPSLHTTPRTARPHLSPAPRPDASNGQPGTPRPGRSRTPAPANPAMKITRNCKIITARDLNSQG
jgi:hypothetical protein